MHRPWNSAARKTLPGPRPRGSAQDLPTACGPVRKKGEKLPSISVSGTSDAIVEERDGRIVRVCGVCRRELDRVTGICPDAAAHAAAR